MTPGACRAYYGVVAVCSYRLHVFCERDPGHLGMHIAAPMGKVVEWIEPEKMRGIVTLTGDEAMVRSPSDRRQTAPWWRRLWRRLVSAW